MLNHRQNDVHVVVRSANERTTSIAKRLARAQLGSDDNISVIAEVPFEAALRATYMIALDAGKKWTMALDADILLSPNAIAELRREAELMPPHYLQVQGRILDKIIGMYRQAGPRIYRTALLRRALEYVPEAGCEIRPESYVLQQMGELGHPSRRVSPMLGLHDFEQYYRDLYRKSFVHAKKHAELVPQLVERCSRNLHDDPDFSVILKGLRDGLAHRGPVAIDSIRYIESFHRAQKELRIHEKSELSDERQFETSIPCYLQLVTKTPPSASEMDDLPPVARSDVEGPPTETRKRGFAGRLFRRLSPF